MSDLLIVDDTPNNLRLLMNLMVDQGHDVRTATSGKMALRSAQASSPDLILLDINMPNMDGYEVCQLLKADPRTETVPVIFLSALSDSMDKVRAFEVGGIDYVTKPFQIEEVLMRVKTQLDLQQMRKQLESQLKDRNNQLNQAQLQLLQQEKMASLGNLVAGIAHELNNPIGFLSVSVRNAQGFLEDILCHLFLYQEHYPQTVEPIQVNAEDIDLDFLQEDFPKMLKSMESAMNRIREISSSLRIFSRGDKEKKIYAALNEGLESTLLILKYRLKGSDSRPAIVIKREYDEIPDIECFPGQLNQVFMNILANAIDMFDEAADSLSIEELRETPQVLTIKTGVLLDQQSVEVQIGDNGLGMTEAVKEKIFDRHFTTKEVGKGTGLGLAIAQRIIAETHGGRLKVLSQVNQGTTFHIYLPISS